jgi:hypothetical protein
MSSDLIYRFLLLLLMKTVTEILIVLATFLPIKAVLISVDQSAPNFLPQSIQALGPQVAAALLISVAIASGLGSRWISSLSKRIALPLRATNDGGGPLASRYLQYSRLDSQSDVASQWLLLAVFTATVGFLAWPMLAFAAIAIASIAFLGWYKIERALTGSRLDRVLSFVREKLQKGSTWIAVGAAMATVITPASPLNVTEMLISVVALRQLVVVMASLRPEEGSTHSETPSAPIRTKAQPSVATKPKRETLFRAVSKAWTSGELPEAMRGLDFSQIPPFFSGESLSLRGVNRRENSIVVVRIFESTARNLPLNELALLNEARPGKFGVGIPENLFEGPTLIGYSFVLSDTKPNALKKDLDIKLALSWEAEVENWCYREFPQALRDRTSTVQSELQGLTDAIESFTKVPGRHQQVLSDLVNRGEQLEKRIWGPNLTLSFKGPLNQRRFFLNHENDVTLLEPSNWRVAPMGYDWPTNDKYAAIIERHLLRLGVSQEAIVGARFARTVRLLGMAARAGDFERIEVHALSLVKVLSTPL